jgi:glycosyltransferase involved in cell wall biosynthesis
VDTDREGIRDAVTKFKPFANPLLILSDRPEDSTGLARVARDLAGLACQMPEFRVAVLGRGSVGKRAFPWQTYSYPESACWGEAFVGEVAADFFGPDHGIILSNWDISRLAGLLRRPEAGADRNWDLWGYFPVDGVGPDGQGLGMEARQLLPSFNRVLAASEWGRGVLVRSGRPDADWLPHGIWKNVFAAFAGDPCSDREFVGWEPDGVYVGCVMTNQSRKDWPVALHAAALLRKEYGARFRFWAHTNTMMAYWNLYALIADYGLNDCIEVSMDLGDGQLASRYAACDCTILPSGAEGFGFPVAESMACGTGCVVADYAAAQELVPAAMRVMPVTMRVDTAWNLQRAVLSGHGFARAAKTEIERKRADWEFVSGENAARVEHLDWASLRHNWTRWLREGLR